MPSSSNQRRESPSGAQRGESLWWRSLTHGGLGCLVVVVAWLGVTATTPAYSSNARPGDSVFYTSTVRQAHNPVRQVARLKTSLQDGEADQTLQDGAHDALGMLTGTRTWGGTLNQREVSETTRLAKPLGTSEGASHMSKASGTLMKQALKAPSTDDAQRLLLASVTLQSAAREAGAPASRDDAEAVVTAAGEQAEITDPVAALSTVVAKQEPHQAEQAKKLWKRAGDTSAKLTYASHVITLRTPADNNQRWYDDSKRLTQGLGTASGYTFAASTAGSHSDYLDSTTKKLITSQRSLGQPLLRLGSHYHGQARIVLVMLAMDLGKADG